MNSEELTMSPPTTNAKRASTRNKTMPPSVTATGKGGGDAVLLTTTTTTSSPPAATSMTQEHEKAAAIGGVPPLHPPPIATITTTTNTTTKKKGRRLKFPHPPPTNAISKNENETHGKEQQQQKDVGSQEQQQQQQQSSFFPRLPSTQCDEEYAKFMKSILGDDQTICTFNTRVTMKREDMNASSSIVVGSTFETLEDDDLSYRLTSDEEEDDDEDEDDDTQDDDGEDDNVDGEDGMMELGENDEEDDKTTSQVVGTSSSFVDYDDDGQQQQQDLFEVLIGEIEDLMEEDQQAAFMTSLAETSGKGGELLSDASARWNGTGFKGGGASGGVAVPTMSKGQVGNTGAVMGTVQQRAITTPGISTKKKKSTTTVINTPPPLSSASGGVGRTTDGDDSTLPGGGAIEVPAVRREQLARLRSIMARHHQLLLQQATLVVRASYVQKVRNVTVNGMLSNATSMSTVKKEDNTFSLPASRLDSKSLTFSINPLVGSGCSYANDFFGGETPEELTESLDGSTAMLQDLERNWKDAARISIQQNEVSSQINMSEFENGCSRRLTRSAFTKTLLEREMEMDNQLPPSPVKQCPSLLPTALNSSANRSSVFDVRGLSRLKESFSVLDHSVKDVQMGREKGIKTLINILSSQSHGKACELLLQHARADIDMNCLPDGAADLGVCLTHAPEVFDDPEKVNRPLTRQQGVELRKNRHCFTAGEDNLILRGANLYGEKEWCLVSDRFLPDRVVNSISQRYNKLCFLIYRANGIEIDEKGKLDPIPTFSKGTSYDVVRSVNIRPALSPTTMNVHRWTLEEDVAILQAVPVMGNLWAEICSKLMPHRDRGHIRKRYQVLQRRIPKGVTQICMKYLLRAEGYVYPPPRSSPAKQRQQRSSPAASKKRETKKKTPASTGNTSPARIFHLAAQAHNKFPSPTRSTAPLSSHASRALFQAVDTIQSGRLSQETSPETREIASMLGGFSQGSRLGHEEISHMGVEKILGNNDDWSQASGMQRLIEAGAAESNFLRDHRHGKSGMMLSHIGDDLPLYQMHDGEASGLSLINGNGGDYHEGAAAAAFADGDAYGRKSIINSVLSNARKRPSSTAFPSTPTKHTEALRQDQYPPSIPTSAISFQLDTPAKDGLSLNNEFFDYLMSEKSRNGLATNTNTERSTSSSSTGINISPIKIGKSIAQYGALSQYGALDGDNSLFDAVAALKDLSNSAPNTPSRLLTHPADIPTEEAAQAPNVPTPSDLNETTEDVCMKEEDQSTTSSGKKAKISFFGQVKAKMDDRKTG